MIIASGYSLLTQELLLVVIVQICTGRTLRRGDNKK
jgi:hypothetical protein